MLMTIIIPTFNEEKRIGILIEYLNQLPRSEPFEIIVSDGGSTDRTCNLAKKAGAKVLNCPQKGRAAQLNLGARHAQSEVLFFLHADSTPPLSLAADVADAIQAGFPIGSYRSTFDSSRLLLKINAFFTRFDKLWCRGGDQGLFITKSLFMSLNGFRTDYLIMEDYDIITRARVDHPFKIIPKPMLISARKYKTNSYLRVQFSNMIIFKMYNKGASQDEMVRRYHHLLNYRYGKTRSSGQKDEA